MTNTLRSFDICLDYEERTQEVSYHFLTLLGADNITHIPYTDTLGQSLQRKGVDYIATILGKEVWIDAKIRTYTGYDYRDIAIESKSLDPEKKKTDTLIYITPNKDNISCYLVDLNRLRKNMNDITPLGIIRASGRNEELITFSISDLTKKSIATTMRISYNVFARETFSKSG